MIQTVKSDEDEMPAIVIGPAFTWLGPPADPYDVFIDGKPERYLSVQKEGLVFDKYGPDST